MSTRSTSATVTFRAPFSLSGHPDELPAGDYEVVVEDELLHGHSFEAWRRTSTFLTVHGCGSRGGRTELRATSDSDLNAALKRDETANGNGNHSEAALSPQEDRT